MLVCGGLALQASPGFARGRIRAPSRAAQTAAAQRALAQRGYRALQVSCSAGSRVARCSWKGTRKQSSCTGTLVRRGISHRRWKVSLQRVRCHALAPARTPLITGFNAYTTPQSVAMQRMVGVSTTRLVIAWAGVEPEPGSFYWGTTDTEYQQILAGGLKPLIAVYAAPCWAASTPCNPSYASPPNPAHDADWITFIHDLVERYPQAAGIEVWSEPNLAANFFPSPNPARFTQLLQDAYTAIKAVNPAMPVISGGLLMDDGSGSGNGGMASRTFLAAMYADGASQWMDALGIHVYPVDIAQGKSPEVWDTAAMTRWLAQVASLRAAAGVTAKPIWITEMGVSTTTEPGFPVPATPEQQSNDLITMMQMAQADPLVAAVMVDSLQDAYPDPATDLVSTVSGNLDGEDVFFNQLNEGIGVFTDTFRPKPAACALSGLLGGTVQCG
jgi:hypothetical protein